MKALRNTFMASLIIAIAFCFIAVSGLSAEVYADEYDIWVGGVRVTSENASDITGEKIESGSGSVSYDVETNTLILNSATILASYISEDVDSATAGTDAIDQGTLGVGIYAKNALNIKVTGNSEIKVGTKGEWQAVMVSEDVPVERNMGIYTGGDLKISGSNELKVNVSGICKYTVDYVSHRTPFKARVIRTKGKLSVNESTLELNLKAAHTDYRSINVESDGDITLSEKSKMTVYCDGPNGMGSFDSQAGAQDAVICNNGKNDIYINNSSTLKVTIGHANMDCTAVKASRIHASGTSRLTVLALEYNYNSCTGKITGVDSDISASDSAEIAITARSSNSENIGIKGDLSAEDSSKARINGTPAYGMQANSAKGLQVSGDAQVEIYGTKAAVQNVTDYTDLASMGATVNSEASSSTAFIWDGSTNFDQYKYVSVPALYSLWVSGTRVSSGNKSNILGDGKVSYDPENNKLTLDGASITTAKSGASNNIVAGIYSQINNLVIELKGENTIESSALAGAAIKADGSDSGDLTITGTGSVDISLDFQSKEEAPSGILTNGLTVDGVTLKLNMSGQKSYESLNTESWLSGFYTTGSLAINNAAIELLLPAAKNASVVGFYSSNDRNISIKGTSDVSITIESDESGAAYNLSGISGSEIFRSPQYNRHGCNVVLSNQAKLNIDLTKADSANGFGTSIGIYGNTTVTGDAKLTVESGKSNHSYGAGLYPGDWTIHGSSVALSAYTISLRASDNAEVSLKAERYASLGSMEASGSAKVTLDGGIAGTCDYQGVKASDDAVVTVKGGDYGISGVLQVNDDAVVEAQGGKKAIRGLVSESDPVGSGKPFEVDDNDGKVVDLRAHNAGTADVNTEATSENGSEWNKEDLLGGDQSPFKYVKIPIDLETLKKYAKAEVNAAFNACEPIDYFQDDYDKIVGFKENAIQAIENAETAEAVSLAREQALTGIDGIQTKVEKINAAIEALKEVADLTLDDSENVEKIGAAYDTLTDEQEALIPAANLQKLNNSKAVVKALQEKKAAEEALETALKDKKTSDEALKKAEADLVKAEKNVFRVLAKVSIKKVKGVKKKITVTWKKVSGTKGYEILVAKNKKGTKAAKTYTVKKNVAKKVIKKLKKGKYYVKVRAYKTFKGNTIYGKYSKVKKVKVK